MANRFTDEWRQFKKAYPEFTKLKGFKGDIGPSMEKIAKLDAKKASLDKEEMQIVGAIYKLAKTTLASLKAYQSIVKNNEMGDDIDQHEAERRIKEWVKELKLWVDGYGSQYKEMKSIYDAMKKSAEDWGS